MSYIDPATILTTDPGDVLTAAWCDTVRDDLEFLIDPPSCSVYHSAAVSISDANLTILSANSENYDNDSMHSTVSSSSRITCQTAGRYSALACVVYASNSSGERLVDFLVNGTTQYVGLAIGPNPSGSQNTGLTVERTMVLNVGDYVEVRTRQRSGGALNCTLSEFALLFLTR